MENARAQSDQLILDLQALRSTAEQTVGDVETRLAGRASLARREHRRVKANWQRLFEPDPVKTAAEKLPTALNALASSKDSNAVSIEKELSRALAELAASETKSDDLQAQLKSAIAAKLAAEALSTRVLMSQSKRKFCAKRH